MFRGCRVRGGPRLPATLRRRPCSTTPATGSPSWSLQNGFSTASEPRAFRRHHCRSAASHGGGVAQPCPLPARWPVRARCGSMTRGRWSDRAAVVETMPRRCPSRSRRQAPLPAPNLRPYGVYTGGVNRRISPVQTGIKRSSSPRPGRIPPCPRARSSPVSQGRTGRT